MEEGVRVSLKNWAEDDKPREKLISKGKSVLSDTELIAILLNIGNRQESAVALSHRLLEHNNFNLATLGRQSLKQLTAF